MKKILIKTAVSVIFAVVVVAATASLWTKKGIFVTFNQDTNSDIEYQIFYTLDETEKSNESHSVKYQAKSTETKIKVQIPETHIVGFRLDQGAKPGQVTISNLKLSGDTVVELKDFNKFWYSPDVEDKIIEDNKITIVSSKNDPYMAYKDSFELEEGTFRNIVKAGLIGIVTFLLSFVLLGALFKKKK